MDASLAVRAKLEERLLRAASKARPAISRRPHAAHCPLSFAQQRLFFFHKLWPGETAYHLHASLRIDGPLRPDLLRQALERVVERHESLRTTYLLTDDDEAVQVIHDQWELAFQQGTVGSEEEARQWFEGRLKLPFDLAAEIPVRACLLELSPERHFLQIEIHHIAGDAWSMNVLARDLNAYYAELCGSQPAALPDLPIQYADYAVWQRGESAGAEMKQQLDYWRERLTALPDLLPLPTDRARPEIQRHRGKRITREIPSRLLDQLTELEKRENATRFMSLLSIFFVLLHRCTGAREIAVGTVVAGRNRVELENLIGFFVNTLVFSAEVDPRAPFEEFLRSVRETSLGAFAHQDAPLEKLVMDVCPRRSLSHSSMFQVMFVLQNTAPATQLSSGLVNAAMDVPAGDAKFDLTLHVLRSEHGLTLALDYDIDLFDEATVAKMLEQYELLLEAALAQPSAPISQLAPLADAAGQQEARNDLDAELLAQPVDGLFARQVEATPHAIALECGDQTVTYAELNKLSTAFAIRLQELGVTAGTRVAVCVPRSIELIAAILGILKCGGAYVPLEPGHPWPRLSKMLLATRPRALVIPKSLRGLYESLDIPLVEVEGIDATRDGELPERTSMGGERLAYVMFTSGSTGEPKGICVPHRGIVRLAAKPSFLKLSERETWLLLAPASFDAATLEIWGCLLTGGTLLIAPPDASLAEIGALIQRRGVTVLWLTSGLFAAMVDEQLAELSGVRQLLTGGDVVSPQHVRKFLASSPGCAVINGYGPTENTTFTTTHRMESVASVDTPIPIGQPISNTRVYILDDHLAPVPPGVAGRLFTSGAGLALGYLDNPELTAVRFLPDPFAKSPGARMYDTGDLARRLPNGDLQFVGRQDGQVKIRGFRVELAEIEGRLGDLPGVREAAVVTRESASGGRELWAYFAPDAELPTAPSAAEVRAMLRNVLPDYMLPGQVIEVPGLPRTVQGKIDRAALPAIATKTDRAALPTPAPAAPRSALESMLTEIWQGILERDQIGVHDNFFEVGGHSLLALKMFARISRKLGKQVPISALFGAPTIAELAALLAEPTESRPSCIVPLQSEGSKRPLFILHLVDGYVLYCRWLLPYLAADQPVFGVQPALQPESRETPLTLVELATGYAQELDRFQPDGPFALLGYSYSGPLALEVARQLERLGRTVDVLAIVDTTPSRQSEFSWKVLLHGPRIIANLPYFLWDDFLQAPFSEQVRRVGERCAWFGRMLRNLFRRRSAPPAFAQRVFGNEEQLPDGFHEMVTRHVEALRHYVAGAFSGRVYLFRARAQRLLRPLARDYGWTCIARRGVEIFRVPRCKHETILNEPAVQWVARRLTRVLDETADRNSDERPDSEDSSTKYSQRVEAVS